MSKVVQEKFEIRNPPNTNEDALAGRWVSDASARKDKHRRQGSQDREMHPGMRNKPANSLDARYNYLGPGMNIEAQRNADIREQPMGGSLGSGTQVTDDVTVKSLRRGFQRKNLRPTDDMYTREHNDAFYDEIEVDGVVGFCERNNYLDRS